VVRTRFIVAAAVALTLGTLSAACGSDDGAGVRDGCGASASGGSASGGASGSACADPGSGSGIADDVEGSSTDNPLVQSALADYTTYVSAQVDDTIAKATTFTDAVRAGDVEAAKAAYAPSRQGWESIEPIAGLVEEIDGAVDSRVDDFAGADAPAFTGWHRLEYIMWEQGTTDGAAPFADQLDADLQTLKAELADLDIPLAALAVGSSELIEEVSTGKISGEEDRYSGTDLWDFAANVAGSEKAFELLEPAIEQEDPDLAAEIGSLFTELDGQLAAYEDGAGGYQPYAALTDAHRTAMQTTLADLSEKLSTVAGVLGLEG